MVKKTRLRQSGGNKRRREKSRPAIARRLEGGIKRGKSVSFETRGLSIGRETQNCTAGFSIFSKLGRDKERGEREGLVEESPLLRDRTNCGTGPQEAPDYYKKKKRTEIRVTVSYALNVRRVEITWLRHYASATQDETIFSVNANQ